MNPLPVAGTITGTAVVCASATTTLSNATTGGVWSSSNTAAATIGTTGIVNGVAAGNATISYAKSNSCGTAYATQVVIVNPLPAAGTITGTAVVCEAATTTLSNATTGGVWSSSNTAVATIGTTDEVSGVAAGTATISYTYTNSCGADLTTKVVTVNPLPVAGTITGTAVVCEAATTTLSNATTGGVWSSSNTAVATIGTTGVVSGVAAGNATISYAYTNSCGTDYTTKVVTVNPLPAAGNITGYSAVCLSDNITLSNSITGGTWSSANTAVASIGTDGILTGVATGATTISYTYTNSCGTDVATHTVTVNTIPSVPSIAGSGTVCAGSATSFSNTTTGGVWSSSDTAVATVGTAGLVTGVTPGTATLSYIVTNDCGTVYVTKVVTVNPSSGSVSGVTSFCNGGTATYTIGGEPGVWTTSHPTIATVGSTTGLLSSVNVGVVTVSFTASTGCFIAVKTVSVINTVGTITGTLRACEGQSATASCAATGGTWSCSNTAIATVNATTGEVTGVEAGSATLTYTMPSGCITTDYFIVYDMPAPITGVNNICSGNTTVLYSTIGGSGTWSCSDTSVATVNITSGMVTGIAAGTAVVTYKIAASGCYVTKSGTVYPTPATISGTPAICAGSTQTFTNTFTGGKWFSSQPSVATIDSITGVETAKIAGSTIISFVMPSGCFRTYSTSVNPLPASITYTANSICLGKTATFASTSTGGTWISSNTAAATIGSSSGIATSAGVGSTTITYTIATGCKRTTALSVYNDLPTITGSDIVLKTYTTTLTIGATSGTWLSGNTSIASINSTTGVVTGMNLGTTTISYRLTGGCLTFKSMTVSAITGTPTACVGLTTTLNHLIAGGTWSTANAAIATINSSGVLTGVGAGTTTVTYTISSGVFNTITAIIYALPAAITGASSICSEASSIYTGTVGGSATWSSSNVSVATIGSTTGLATGVATGTATLTYKIAASGCYTTRQITINPSPATITGPSTACVGTTVTLANTVSGGTWASNPTTVATVGSATGIVSATTAGGVTISYTLANGCRKTKALTINVSPATITGPSILSPGSSSLSPGAPSTFSCASTTGTWSVSDATLAVILSSTATTASIAGIASGTVSVLYTIANGCYKSKDVTVVGFGAKSAAVVAAEDEAAFFKVYPNPTTGVFNVESSLNGNLSIYTYDGKLINEYQLNGNTTRVSLPTDLAAGIYICQFRFEDGTTKTTRLYFRY